MAAKDSTHLVSRCETLECVIRNKGEILQHGGVAMVLDVKLWIVDQKWLPKVRSKDNGG